MTAGELRLFHKRYMAVQHKGIQSVFKLTEKARKTRNFFPAPLFPAPSDTMTRADQLRPIPLYHTGQEVYMHREVKQLPRAAKVKIRRYLQQGRDYRYEVEYEGERHWCYEYDLSKYAVAD